MTLPGIAATLGLLALTSGLGICLSRSGRPYGPIILTIHKLVSLAALGYLFIILLRMHQAAALRSTVLSLGMVVGLLFLAAIISGGLVSIDRPAPAALLAVHRVTPILTALCVAVTLYVLR